MDRLRAVIFCLAPGIKARIEDVYASEADAARELGMHELFLDHDEVLRGDLDRALRRVPVNTTPQSLIYRGWMMPVKSYTLLHRALAKRGWELCTSPEDYAACHLLPGWYRSLEGLTPSSKWIEHGPPFDDKELCEALAHWNGPVIVKDYVKSEKHAWNEACFIPDPRDTDASLRVIRRFIELRDDAFEGGLVLREFVPLAQAGVHPQSAMPLSREIRTFWRGDRCVMSSGYWDARSSEAALPTVVVRASQIINRPFYTIDAAQLASGEWIVIEIGDGQVSAIPDGADVHRFYANLTPALG